MTLLREAKPEWAHVPATVQQALGHKLGSPVVDAHTAWGGYSPSASYLATLQDGRRVFIKGAHPGQTANGIADFKAELSAYERHPELARVAPRYICSVEVGEWHLMALEAIEGGEKLLPWTETKLRKVFAALNQLAALIPVPTPDLVPMCEFEPLADLVNGKRGWCTVQSAGQLAKINALFISPEQAAGWFAQLMPHVLKLETHVAQLKGRYQAVHVDLRSDNLLLRADGRVAILDWPNLCWGPLAFELIAFINTVVLETGWPHEQIISWAEDETGQHFAKEDWLICAANLSGYFVNAGLHNDIPALPRLRVFQRAQFLAFLPWLARLLELPPPPEARAHSF